MIHVVSRYAAVAGIALFLVSCGSSQSSKLDDDDSEGRSFATVPPPTNYWALREEEDTVERSNFFRRLVVEGEYRKAMRYACLRHNLPCGSVKILEDLIPDPQIDRNADGADGGDMQAEDFQAKLSWLDNTIILRKTAFFYPPLSAKEAILTDNLEQIEILADDRMLALHLAHEIFHRDQQSRTKRYYAAVAEARGFPEANNWIEYDAWNNTAWMARNDFGLDNRNVRDGGINNLIEGKVNEYAFALGL